MLRLKEKEIRSRIAATGDSVRAWGGKHGFPQTSLSHWITGTRNIKRGNLERLAAALRCNPDDISEPVIIFAGVDQLETDRQEIAGIFGNLNAGQRQAIITMAQTIADARRKGED